MDRIEIRGIRAYGRHGADPGERDRPQAFSIDVVADVDLALAQRSDDLNDTLDYARLYRRIVEVVADTSYALLERLAADLLDAAFEDRRVERVQISVGKPGLLDGATPSVTIARERHRAYVGIGSNVGDPIANVLRAIEALLETGIVVARSSLYRTKPWGKTDQPEFVNAVVRLETTLEPRALLDAFKNIEKRLGRTPAEHWGPRAIDLDLLAYDNRSIDEPGLRVPHAQIAERAFVLVPLAEIDSSYEALRDALSANELAGVRKL